MFDRDIFLNFATKLSIPSKEGGLVQFRPNRPQMYMLDQLEDGLKKGIRHFTIIKAGQMGCTTFCIMFDLFWLFSHPGTIGQFIADDNSKRAFFNTLIRQFVRSLEPYPEFRIPVLKQNAEELSLENQSMLVFNHANQRTKGMLGRGIGTAFVHGTECAFWSDEDSWKSLLDRLAQRNPNRLFLFESTANGHNFYKAKWDIARRSSDQKAIFLGWWLHEDCTFKKDDPVYQTYWGTKPRLDRDEALWVEVVKRSYNYQITSGQMAWWRWKLDATYQGDTERMYQENPPYDQLAFQFTGKAFINKKVLNQRMATVEIPPRTPRYFRFRYGEDFMETQLEELGADNPFTELTVWEEPKFGRGVLYAIGCDPAHGADQDGCNAAICGLRCYADKVEQVFEFARNELPSWKLAYAILYLYGAYSNDTMYGMETQGGGDAAFQFIDRIRGQVGEACPPDLAQHFRSLQTYMYSRMDAAKKSFNSLHFKTSESFRSAQMDIIRTYVERQNVCIIHSKDLLEELAGLVRQEGDRVDSADSTDRAMAFGFALRIYVDHLSYKIGSTKYRYDYDEFIRDRSRDEDKYTTDDLIADHLLNWKRKYMPGGVSRVI